MTKAPAFQFYPADFLMGTMGMTHEERGIYITLLCVQWDRGSLPSDSAQLRVLAGTRRAIPAAVLAKFADRCDGTISNERLEAEREKQMRFREQQAERARQRWDKDGSSEPMPRHKSGTADAKPSGRITDGNALRLQSSSPSSNNIPLESPKGDEPLEFPAVLDTERFRAKWAEYEAHRRESRYKKLTGRSVRMQLASLADHGEAIAIAAVDLTMANGWRGIFPEKVAEMRARPGNPPARLSNAMPSEPSPDYLPAMVVSWAQELNTYLQTEPSADPVKREKNDRWARELWTTAIARLSGHAARERAFWDRVRLGLTREQVERFEQIKAEFNQQAAKEAA